MKHTQRPWIIDGYTIRQNNETTSDIRDICYINDEVGSKETDYFSDGQMAIANAKLIAAAPDLLEACKETLKVFKHYVDWSNDKDDIRCYQMLENAINKAEGK